jgi:phage tail-like protein
MLGGNDGKGGSGKTPTGDRVEVHAGFRFAVNIGEGDLFFTECTLPSLEVDVAEQKEGGYNSGVHLLPGPVKAGRLTLKRGLTKSSALLAWYAQIARGEVKGAMRNVTLTMLDSEGRPVMRMDFIRAYPVKWSGPSFRAGDSTIAIETLELAFAEVQVQDGGAGAKPASGPPGAASGGQPFGPTTGAGNVW